MTLTLLVTVLIFTVSEQEAYDLDCTQEGGKRDCLASVVLYGDECGGTAMPRFMRSHPFRAVQDTFQVWDAGCATYFIAVTDCAGNESCWVAATVGIPPVSVPPIPRPGPEVFYDIQGRKVRPPLRNGIYFSTKQRRWVVVLK